MGMSLSLGIGLTASALRTGGGYPFSNGFARAYVARMVEKPTSSVSALIDALCSGLEADGAFAVMDAVYLFALETAQQGLINMAQNRFDCVSVNSPLFTPLRGYTPDGVTSYLNTGINPASSPTLKSSQDNFSMQFWPLTSLSNTGGTSHDLGNGACRLSRSSANSLSVRANTGTTDTAIGANAYPGLIGLTRASAAAYDVYKNGADVGGASTVSIAPVSESFTIGRAASAGFGANQIAMACFGGNAAPSLMASIYSRFLTFLHDASIGAV